MQKQIFGYKVYALSMFLVVASSVTQAIAQQATYNGTTKNVQLQQIVVESLEKQSIDVEKSICLKLYDELCSVAENPKAKPFERVVAIHMLGSAAYADGATDEQKAKQKSLAPLYWEEGNHIEMRMYARLLNGNYRMETPEQENAFFVDAIRNCKFAYTRANATHGGDPKSSPELLQCLIDLGTNPKRRGWKTACEELRDLPELAGPAVPKFIEVFDEIARSDQFQAIYVISAVRHDPKVTLPFLKNLIENDSDRHGQSSLSAWSAIAMRNNLPIDEIISHTKRGIKEEWIEDPNRIARVLKGKAQPLVPDLVALMKENDHDHYLFRNATAAVASIGPGSADAAPLIIGAIKKTTGYERLGLIEKLSMIGAGGKEFAPIAKQLLADKESASKVLLALASMGPEAAEAAPAILPFIEESNLFIARPAMRAIRNMGSAGHVANETLKKLADANEHRWQVHSAAIALFCLHPENEKVTAYAIDKLEHFDDLDIRLLGESEPNALARLHKAVAASDNEKLKRLKERLQKAAAKK